MLQGFVIIGFVIFMLGKAYNRATNKAEEQEGPSETDLLVSRSGITPAWVPA